MCTCSFKSIASWNHEQSRQESETRIFFQSSSCRRAREHAGSPFPLGDLIGLHILHKISRLFIVLVISWNMNSRYGKFICGQEDGISQRGRVHLWDLLHSEINSYFFEKRIERRRIPEEITRWSEAFFFQIRYTSFQMLKQNQHISMLSEPIKEESPGGGSPPPPLEISTSGNSTLLFHCQFNSFCIRHIPPHSGGNFCYTLFCSQYFTWLQFFNGSCPNQHVDCVQYADCECIIVWAGRKIIRFWCNKNAKLRRNLHQLLQQCPHCLCHVVAGISQIPFK